MKRVLSTNSMQPKPLLFGMRLAVRWNRYDIRQNARWIKKELIHMGPAYVKMGQLVATRSDLFPEPLVTELSTLHDDVPPCPFEDIRTLIEHELNSPLYETFSEFSEESISSASIGQIHIATLQKYPDIRIAVKVQRPYIDSEFKQDLDSILFVSRMSTLISPQNKQMTDLYNVLSQSRQFIENELDFSLELNNIRAMKRAFENESFIRIPRVIPSVSTKRVLVMEYVESNKLKSVDPDNINDMTRTMVRSIVRAALEHGVIHGDLHPGNMGVLPTGIVLYDFGLMLEINPSVVKTLMNAVLTNDPDMLLDTLVSNQLVYIDDPVIGKIQLKRMIMYVIEYITNLNFKQLIENISNDVTLNTDRLYFHVDSRLFLISRTMTLLEGTCRTVDKSFMYTDVILDMLMDFQNMDYIDMDVMMNKGWNDVQMLLRNESPDSKSADDILFFSTKMKNNNQYSLLIRILLACALFNMYVF